MIADQWETSWDAPGNGNGRRTRYLVTLAASAPRLFRNVGRSKAPGWACVHESDPIMTHQLGLAAFFSTGFLRVFPALRTYNNCLVQTSNGANIFIPGRTFYSARDPCTGERE